MVSALSLDGKGVRLVVEGMGYVHDLMVIGEIRCGRELRVFLPQSFPPKDPGSLPYYMDCESFLQIGLWVPSK